MHKVEAYMHGLCKEAAPRWAKELTGGGLSMSALRRLRAHSRMPIKQFIMALRSYVTPRKVMSKSTLEEAVRALGKGNARAYRDYLNLAQSHGRGAKALKDVRHALADTRPDKASLAFTGARQDRRPTPIGAMEARIEPDSSWAPSGRRNYYDHVRNMVTRSGNAAADRHEMGHWLADIKMTHEPDKARRQMGVLYGRLHRTGDEATRGVLERGTIRMPLMGDVNLLTEGYGHWLAARHGLRGSRLRQATREGWTSPWADRLRTGRGSAGEPMASVAEHLERNYGVAEAARRYADAAGRR
jgi:hypothetical protein